MNSFYAPRVANNAIKYDFGLTVSLQTNNETIVNILPTNNLSYEAIFFQPKCDFSIILGNSGRQRVMVNISGGRFDFGNFIVRQNETFVLHTTPYAGKRFCFDATNLRNDNLENWSSNLKFSMCIEKNVPGGQNIRIKSLTGKVETVDIDTDCTIAELKQLYSLKVPFKTSLYIKRDA
ncbi:ubiquitin like protein [Dasychira pudibunda nucleopolyhedrovirus]|nr:ubiquitin like protein [Dasychira pudibunda nucleopolyhedrovirus]WHM28395.1 ubiquitin [Dasychira pudibunda nucleopolyhedrovirus]